MSQFSTVISQLEDQALAAWKSFEAQVEAEAIQAYQVLEPVVESAFAQLVTQLGDLATQTVISLMHGAQASLSGGEKFNLTVTTLVDAAEKQALAIAQSDASALAKNAYLAVMAARSQVQ